MPPLDPLPEFDLYAELDVAPDADSGAIERAWRAGVRSVHPDRARSGEERAATARTARLNIAREWLMDPSKRERYDLLRRPGPSVVLPDVDPLGSWPARPRPHRSYRMTFLVQGIPAFLAILVVSLLVWAATGFVAMVVFAVGLFGLYAGLWLLIGAVSRPPSD